MLQLMLEVIEKSDTPDVGNCTLREKGPKRVLTELGEQVSMFWHNEFPFRYAKVNSKTIVDPLAWWQNMANHDSAQVLRVSPPPVHMP